MNTFLSVALMCFFAFAFYGCENVRQDNDVENPMADNYEEQQEENIPTGEIDSAIIKVDESSEMIEYEIGSVEDELDGILENEN